MCLVLLWMNISTPMAHKRMFSKDITTSDAFREMPASSQSLYFHLGMEADDDGFLDNYKGLMRSINASDDDLRVLLGKRFLILFPSKVVVVKHWLINNTVRKDRYSETKHLEEKRALIVKENGAYTELSDGLPNGNQLATQYRIGKDRKEEIGVADAPQITTVSEKEEKPKSQAKYPNARAIFKEVFGVKYPRSWDTNTTELFSGENLFLEHGIEESKEAYEWYLKHKPKDFALRITCPSELDRKFPKLEAYFESYE